jgi:hypothetical protein
MSGEPPNGNNGSGAVSKRLNDQQCVTGRQSGSCRMHITCPIEKPSIESFSHTSFVKIQTQKGLSQKKVACLQQVRWPWDALKEWP